MESKIILAKNINMDKNYINVLSYNENQVLELLNSPEHFVASNNKYTFIQPSSIFVEFTFGVKKTALEEYTNLTAKMTILKEAFEKYPDEIIETIITHMEKKRNNTVK